jgi:hypothetical protein
VGTLVVVIVSDAENVTEKLAVAVLLAESFTCTVKLAVPAVGELAATTPAPDTLSPTALRLLLPEVTDHEKPVPLPPLAARVWE